MIIHVSVFLNIGGNGFTHIFYRYLCTTMVAVLFKLIYIYKFVRPLAFIVLAWLETEMPANFKTLVANNFTKPSAVKQRHFNAYIIHHFSFPLWV